MESEETKAAAPATAGPLKLRQAHRAKETPVANGPTPVEASKRGRRAKPKVAEAAAPATPEHLPAAIVSKLPALVPFITPTSLALPEMVSYETLQSIGHALHLTEGAQMWWVGDYLNIAEKRCGEEQYQRILNEFTYDAQTLMAAKWVAKQFAPGERRSGLSWSHHREVAHINLPTRKRWLDRAEQEHMSRSAFRDAIKEAARISGEPLAPHKRGPKPQMRAKAPIAEASVEIPPPPKGTRKPQLHKGESQEAMVGRYLDQLFNATGACVAPAEKFLELAESVHHKLSPEGNEGLEFSDMEALKAADADLANALPNLIEPLEALLAQREK